MTGSRLEKVRYWLFPETRMIHERTAELDQHRTELKRLKEATAHVVHNANQPDVLRNLVIAMQSAKE